jgi:phosphomevalonate kinase
MAPVVVSSPGKVLLAGGYLVLDPNYSGLVVSTSSRFYTVVQDAVAGAKEEIQVRSPQFLDARWIYTTQFDAGGVLVEQITDKSNTPSATSSIYL